MLLASPLIADVMDPNAAVCGFTGIHPVCMAALGGPRGRGMSERQSEAVRETERGREKTVIIVYCSQLFIFPQQPRRIVAEMTAISVKTGFPFQPVSYDSASVCLPPRIVLAKTHLFTDQGRQLKGVILHVFEHVVQIN